MRPLVALAIPIVVLGIFPEQFVRIADLASAGLIDSTAYVRAVFPAGGRLMSRYLNNILLALVWAALTGSFTLPNFAFGLLLGWLALYLVREQLGPRRGALPRRPDTVAGRALHQRTRSVRLARRAGS